MPEPTPAAPPAQPCCAHLNQANPGRRFRMNTGHACWRCAIRNRAMLRRSILTAILVGTILVAINQGTIIIAGEATTDLAWKIPLTYTVPFLVTTWGALGNAYTQS